MTYRFLNPNAKYIHNPNFSLTLASPIGEDIPDAMSFLNSETSLTGLPSTEGGGGNGFTNFLNSDGFKTGLGAVQTAAGLWNAYNANKLAKQQFRFTKNFANANLANQTQSYNTALNDRARTRGFMEGQSQSQIDQYIANNRLKDRTV